jgi:hypothetical protein
VGERIRASRSAGSVATVTVLAAIQIATQADRRPPRDADPILLLERAMGPVAHRLVAGALALAQGNAFFLFQLERHG